MEETSDNTTNRTRYSSKAKSWNNIMPNPKINQINSSIQIKTKIVNKEYNNSINAQEKEANLTFTICIYSNKNKNKNIKTVQNQINIKY